MTVSDSDMRRKLELHNQAEMWKYALINLRGRNGTIAFGHCVNAADAINTTQPQVCVELETPDRSAPAKSAFGNTGKAQSILRIIIEILITSLFAVNRGTIWFFYSGIPDSAGGQK